MKRTPFLISVCCFLLSAFAAAAANPGVISVGGTQGGSNSTNLPGIINPGSPNQAHPRTNYVVIDPNLRPTESAIWESNKTAIAEAVAKAGGAKRTNDTFVGATIVNPTVIGGTLVSDAGALTNVHVVKPLVITDGHSMVSGGDMANPTTDALYAQLAALPSIRGLTVTNYAFGGKLITNVVTDFFAFELPKLRAARSNNLEAVWFCWIGVNDIAQWALSGGGFGGVGSSGNQTYSLTNVMAKYESMLIACKTNGITTIVVSEVANGYDMTYFSALRDQLYHSTNIDMLIDPYDFMPNQDDRVYWTSGGHPTFAATRIVALELASAITSWGNKRRLPSQSVITYPLIPSGSYVGNCRFTNFFQANGAFGPVPIPGWTVPALGELSFLPIPNSVFTARKYGTFDFLFAQQGVATNRTDFYFVMLTTNAVYTFGTPTIYAWTNATGTNLWSGRVQFTLPTTNSVSMIPILRNKDSGSSNFYFLSGTFTAQ